MSLSAATLVNTSARINAILHATEPVRSCALPLACPVVTACSETPFKVDYTKLPAVATAKAMSDAERPRFELHHGFDIAKTDRDEAAPPIEPRKVVDGLTKEAGMSNGGWFVFAKNDVWAYRCNEFSNASYETCIAELVRQSEQLHAWLAREAAGRKVIEQTCSLEKVLAMWPFH